MSPAVDCGVGTLLLQPQRVKRATTADPEQALVDDFLDLVVRLAGDAHHGGTLLHTIGLAAQAAAEAFIQALFARLDAARSHLQGLLSPLGTRVQGIVDLFSQGANPFEILKGGIEQLEALATAVGGLSIDSLRHMATAFVTVIETDLGLSSQGIQDIVWGFVTDLIARIDAAPVEATAFLRQNRRQFVSVLRRIERQFRSSMALPAFDAEAIARDAFDHISRSKLGPAVATVACEAKEITKGLQAVDNVVSAIPFSGFGSHSLGAAAAKPASGGYLWYPSWLLATKDLTIPLPWRKAHIWTGDDGKIYRRDQVLFNSTQFDWTAIPSGDPSTPPMHYTFRASPDVMEKLAWVTSWLADLGEGILHLVHATPGDNVGDYIQGGLLLGDIILEAAARMPWEFWIKFGAGVGDNFGGWLLAESPLWATVFGSSFQGFHTKAAAGPGFKFWFILLAFDVMSTVSAATLPSALRDFVLSVLTLINYDGPGTAPSPDNRPENRKEVDGIIGLTSVLFGWLSVRIFPREEYSIFGLKTAKFWLLRWLLIGGVAFGLMGGLAGVLVADAFARTFDVEVFLKKSATAMAKAFATWPFLLYGFRENDTDGGKYQPASQTPFLGYPPKATSPYKLPYAKDKPICCVQGNQGFFSHNHVNPVSQVYSYDLALDQEDEVLAARDGTVVDWFDWVPNDTSDSTPGVGTQAGQTSQDSWNFVAIRHDTVAADHDKDEGGAQVTTYALYGHGRFGSVQQVFQARGVAPGNIIGTAVKQGQVIMLAGSTGISFHNHTHIEVRSLAGAGSPPASPPPAGTAVARSLLNQWTIPFVFNEPSLDADGVPKSKTFYKSTNERLA